VKDAQGHGSNPRGGDQSYDRFAASKRAGLAAHQSYINEVGRPHDWTGALLDQVHRFAHSESGAGHPLAMEKDLRKEDPEKLGRFIADQVHNIAEGRMGTGEGLHTPAHIAHLLV
jgi:hypothetical protein